ncbi:MAG TPA: hypothetical protein VGM44_01310 [Polyangiaceae bacterium]|jgi:hypothetical protein
MNDVMLGMRLARERLRGFVPPFVFALSALGVYAFAVIERQSDAGSAADTALEGAVFGLVLPVLAYLLSERVCDAPRLDRAVDPLARYGADRRQAMLGVFVVSALCTAFAGSLLALIALFGARSVAEPGFVSDLRASAALGVGVGAIYALFFAAASLLGKRGGGRKWALILDFVLGAGSSLLALPFPRGHARNLLGGAPVLELSQGGAGIALALIGCLCVALSMIWTAS